jgi:phosphatidylinositol phospholipase C, delta
LSRSEVRKLLGHLNVEMSSKDLKSVFRQVDENNSGELDFEEFSLFLELLCDQPLVSELYTGLGGADTLTETSFAGFLREQQHEKEIGDEAVRALMATAMKDAHQSVFNVQAFAHYLGSTANSAFNAAHATVFQDTSLPMNAYWMNSSHNTYLVGDQLKGRSEVQQYRRVMDQGCRCVELDCWDGKKGEPIVFHGHTLTSKIYFVDVCKSVAEHAFTHSPYPVVLSLENHTGSKQQRRMAEHLKACLGHLMLPNFQDRATIPSLDELKNKVLIKCSTSVVPELAELIHLASTAYEPAKEKPSWKITSFAEGSFKKMGKNSVEAIDYTNRHMARLYPAGNRVNSSNYDPSMGWACGVQLVALNFQTQAMPIYLNQIRVGGATLRMCSHILYVFCAVGG